jgi:hypothetical protein
MAKQAGLNDKLLVDGYNLSGDIGSASRIGSNSDVFDVSAINVSAYERILGKADGAIEFNAFFNKATDQEHLILRAKRSGANAVCCYLHDEAIGDWGAGIVAKQVNYDPSRPADGSLTIDVQMIGALYGLDHGEQLTAGLRTDTEATNGASHNNGAASSRGLSAYLQVTAFTGTDVTMTIQQSSDNGSGDAFAAVTGGAFTQVTGVTAERIVTSLTQAIEQYLRVVTSTSGGVTSVTFSVIVCRSPVA